MTKTYLKIPGLGAGGGSFQLSARSRLFAGPDHLLLMKTSGYNEEYKRIFFRDIRFVEVRPTKVMVTHAAISALLTLFLLAILVLAEAPILADVLLCAPFLIWFGVNLYRGPSCICSINTSVQTLDLPVPRRMKKVPILVAFLRSHAPVVATSPETENVG